MAKDPKLLESQKDSRTSKAPQLQTGVMELIDKHWKEMVRNLEACYENWASRSCEEFPSPQTWAEFEVTAFVETMRKEHSMGVDKLTELVRTLPPLKEVVRQPDQHARRPGMVKAGDEIVFGKADDILTGDLTDAIVDAPPGSVGFSANVAEHDVMASKPDSELPEEPICIRPAAYLRAMFSIAFHSFRHPLSTTVVDLASGKAVSEGAADADSISS